jgi:hypothetical protein
MVVAGRDIDTSLGVHSETHSGMGAWKDGAEDTTISIVHGATWNKIRAIARLAQGYLTAMALKNHLLPPKYRHLRLRG